MKSKVVKDVCPEAFIDRAVQMVADNVEALSTRVLTKDDPFFPLAMAELKTRIIFDLKEEFGSTFIDGLEYRSHVIFVFDGNETPDNIVAFLTYRPRTPGFKCATIGHIVVDKRYRMRGVMRLMLSKLLDEYDSISLGCRIELVDMYRKFGFDVEQADGSQVGMATGPMTGDFLTIDDETIFQRKLVRETNRRITALLGENAKKAYRDMNQRQEDAESAVKVFVKDCFLNSSNS